MLDDFAKMLQASGYAVEIGVGKRMYIGDPWDNLIVVEADNYLNVHQGSFAKYGITDLQEAETIVKSIHWVQA